VVRRQIVLRIVMDAVDVAYSTFAASVAASVAVAVFLAAIYYAGHDDCVGKKTDESKCHTNVGEVRVWPWSLCFDGPIFSKVPDK
jgi:hypothetical protein